MTRKLELLSPPEVTEIEQELEERRAEGLGQMLHHALPLAVEAFERQQGREYPELREIVRLLVRQRGILPHPDDVRAVIHDAREEEAGVNGEKPRVTGYAQAKILAMARTLLERYAALELPELRSLQEEVSGRVGGQKNPGHSVTTAAARYRVLAAVELLTEDRGGSNTAKRAARSFVATKLGVGPDRLTSMEHKWAKASRTRGVLNADDQIRLHRDVILAIVAEGVRLEDAIEAVLAGLDADVLRL